MKFLPLLYIVPLWRLCCLPLFRRRYIPWRRTVNLWVGRAEWFVQSWRDSLFLGGWLGYWCYHVIHDGRKMSHAAPARWLEFLYHYWPSLAIAAGAVALSAWSRRARYRHRLALLEYARQWPRIDPREYFHAFFAGFGPLPLGLPEAPPVLRLPTLDFRNRGRVRRRVWPVLHGVWSTIFIASQVLLARRHMGSAASVDLFSALMEIWGARLLMLGECMVHVQGIERLSDLSGQCVLCFNHKGAFDFAVAPAVLGLADLHQRGPLRIRYLVAKDHFLDNWWLYRGIGIGRAVEAVGMVFVNRRGQAAERREAIPAAVEQLIARGVDVAIYPQGTRAPGNRGPDGERLDAGYFTVGDRSRRRRLGAHLKKGAAHLAVTAAVQLAEAPDHPPLHILPIALVGTATALPKGSLRIQTGTEMKVIVGEPLTLRGVRATEYDQLVATVHAYVDQQLEHLQGLRSALATRFLTSIGHMLPADAVEQVAELLQTSRQERLIYPILDTIYAAAPSTWHGWERALADRLMEGAVPDQLEQLYRMIVDAT